MSAIHPPSDAYNVAERLFSLIDGLSVERQFTLYRHLIRDRITAQIFKLIIDMSDAEKAQLLEEWEETPFGAEPVRTVDLDENESFMRRNYRRICRIPVRCKIGDNFFNSNLTDISLEGVYIEVQERFASGRQMEMIFGLPNQPGTMKIQGRVIHSGPDGVGVAFQALNPDYRRFIQAFISKKQ